MPEEIDPFAVNTQPEAERESLPQEDVLGVVDDTPEASSADPEEILDSINSVPNPVQTLSVERESILSRVKPRGRKSRKTPPPVDGVAPYGMPVADVNADQMPRTDDTTTAQEFDTASSAGPSQIEQPEFEDIPEHAGEAPYQPEQGYSQQYQQPEYLQQQSQQYPIDQDSTGANYANPLLTNQPLPVNYTAPNIYDPYNPYAAMVDINQGSPGAPKPTDWRFVITLGAGIVCLAGLIFFWIMWGSTAASLTEATIQMEELRATSETGQKAANQLTDLQTTIRELNTKIEDLQEENDELKKNEDDIKDLEKENSSLDTKVKDLQAQNATLTNDVEYWKKKAE